MPTVREPDDRPQRPDALLTPPADPEDWSEEQWIDWLEATDDLNGAGEGGSQLSRARTRNRGGALGAAMLGLRDAIYGRPDEVVAVADASGDPPGDDEPQVLLDLEHPENSKVVIRRRAGPPAPS